MSEERAKDKSAKVRLKTIRRLLRPLGIDMSSERLLYAELKPRFFIMVCHQFGAHKKSGFKGEEVCLRCHSEDEVYGKEGQP